MLQAHGFTPSTRVLESRVYVAGDPQLDPAIAGTLALDEGEQVLFISKLFHEDSVPVILAHNYLPLRLTTEPYTPADLDRPVYDFLEQFSRHRLAYYLSEIIPVNADATMAAVLQINSGAPLLSFDETGYNNDSEPILKAYSYFRDDLLRFRLLRRRV